MKLVFSAVLLITHCAFTPASGQDASAPSGEKKSADSSFVMKKSPMGAVLRSALLPGWGQLYNESYWKVPVVVGLGAFLIRGVIVENNGFLDYGDRYTASITDERPSGDLRLKQLRELYRDNRDSYAWWFLILYLVQIADAFVDAHLYDFDVSDSVGTLPSLTPAGSVVTLRIRL